MCICVVYICTAIYICIFCTYYCKDLWLYICVVCIWVNIYIYIYILYMCLASIVKCLFFFILKIALFYWLYYQYFDYKGRASTLCKFAVMMKGVLLKRLLPHIGIYMMERFYSVVLVGVCTFVHWMKNKPFVKTPKYQDYREIYPI